MPTVKQVQAKANALQKKLTGKTVVENFGQREVRQLQDFAGNIFTDYPYSERRQVLGIIDRFDSWCMNYTGR
jgi:hypothetical protein